MTRSTWREKARKAAEEVRRSRPPAAEPMTLEPGGLNYVENAGKVAAPISVLEGRHHRSRLLAALAPEGGPVQQGADNREGPAIMTADEMKTIRKGLGLTQGELGRWLMLSATQPGHTVRMWELGKNPINGPVAVAVRAFAAGYRPTHIQQG